MIGTNDRDGMDMADKCGSDDNKMKEPSQLVPELRTVRSRCGRSNSISTKVSRF